MKKIGLVGTGLMGAPMALNLLKGGFEVMVINRTPAKCRRVAEAGGRVADSLSQLIRSSEVVVLVVDKDESVRQIVTAPGGVAESGSAGLIVIDSTTVHPHTSNQMCETLAAKDIAFLDAPVTGSRPQAEEGALTFLVGGDRAAYERCVPLFEAMGRRQFHLGGSGMGACAKVCNNLMGMLHLAALSEGMSLAERYGLDRKDFFEVISQSGARSAVVDGKGPKILADDFAPDFALKLAVKDVALARRLAEDLGHDTPVLAAAASVYGEAAASLGGEGDLCSLYNWYRRGGSSEQRSV